LGLSFQPNSVANSLPQYFVLSSQGVTMTIPTRLRHHLSLLVLGLGAATLVGNVLAADMPKRKPGLWEINMRMEGVPNLGPMQQCIDQNTDNLLQQKAKDSKKNCSVMEITPVGNKVSIHSVCKVEGSTATTDAFFEGAFDANYTGKVNTRFDPPLYGRSESNMTLEGRWLSACKPGQKPGDVVMPSIGGVNLNEMMKDPRVQDMMKRQQQAR
jgi:hypothetical protein